MPKAGRIDQLLRADRGGHRLRRRRRAAGDVCHRGHDARRSGDAAAAVLDGDPRRRQRGCASPTPSATRRRTARQRSCGSSATWSRSAAAGSASTGTATAIAISPSINSLAALEAGATRLHGAAIGIGERVGNTPMDTLLVNLVLMGYIERDLSALVEYCETVSAATGVPIPPNYPVVGRDAFRTATGVHAAAVIKAFRKKDHELVDAVYSGVPAGMVGREQEIDVGPMSGDRT